MRNTILLGGAIGIASALGAISWPAQAPQTKSVPGPVVPPGYDLVPSFTEDFDGATLNTRTWITAFAPRGVAGANIEKRTLPSNGERAIYVDKSYLGLGIDPFRVSGGALTIEAKPLSPGDRAAILADADRVSPAARKPVWRDLAYSTGAISTRGGFAQKYGYFEMRARWSAGRGVWPAFWLLPEDGSWPPEIDIVEAHGDKPTVAYQSTHYNAAPKATTREGVVPGSPQEFHRYGVLWLPDRIDYFIDGKKTNTLPVPPEMTKKMHFVVSLAIGGYWPGYPNASTQFPATMVIDYVRAWRFRNAPPAK